MAYGYGGCNGNCTAACGSSCYACGGSCGGGCSGGCGGGCDGCSGCSGSCEGSCTGCTGCDGCSGSCEGACNSGCAGGAMNAIYNRLIQLGLHQYIEAQNVQDILDLSYYEAVNRRGKPGTTGHISQYTQEVIEEFFNYAQNNLKNIGYSFTYNGNTYNLNNKIVLRAMAQEIIDKELQSYRKVVGRP